MRARKALLQNAEISSTTCTGKNQWVKFISLQKHQTRPYYYLFLDLSSQPSVAAKSEFSMLIILFWRNNEALHSCSKFCSFYTYQISLLHTDYKIFWDSSGYQSATPQELAVVKPTCQILSAIHWCTCYLYQNVVRKYWTKKTKSPRLYIKKIWKLCPNKSCATFFGPPDIRNTKQLTHTS